MSDLQRKSDTKKHSRIETATSVRLNSSGGKKRTLQICDRTFTAVGEAKWVDRAHTKFLILEFLKTFCRWVPLPGGLIILLQITGHIR